jgi:uncharacterized protein YkvS
MIIKNIDQIKVGDYVDFKDGSGIRKVIEKFTNSIVIVDRVSTNDLKVCHIDELKGKTLWSKGLVNYSEDISKASWTASLINNFRDTSLEILMLNLRGPYCISRIGDTDDFRLTIGKFECVISNIKNI